MKITGIKTSKFHGFKVETYLLTSKNAYGGAAICGTLQRNAQPLKGHLIS
jgi:hypothetical protein